jgi:tripartite-type tricarboxylate transporter receptor subunit TctC
MTSKLIFGAILGASMMAAGSASADFFKGKQVSMLINFAAGGPADIEGRIMAQHLPKHIPGNPRVIVRNMGGGGGMIATNYLGEVAKPDGLTFGFFTWNVIAAMIGDPGLRVNYDRFQFIAGVPNPVVFYARRDTPPGLKAPGDLMKASGFRACSLSPQSANTVQQVLAFDLLGIDYRPVPGYQGLKAVEGAILKNECQVANSSLPGWKGSVEPAMGGEVISLFHLVAADETGAISRDSAVPEIPTFEEYYAEHKGGTPSGPGYDALRQIADNFMAMFRAAFAAPDAPKESVEALREGFRSLWKDEQFLADYEKRVRNRPGLIIGEAGAKRITEVANVKPEVAEHLRTTIERLSR